MKHIKYFFLIFFVLYDKINEKNEVLYDKHSFVFS